MRDNPLGIHSLVPGDAESCHAAPHLEVLVQRAAQLTNRASARTDGAQGRALLGLTGAPGAGKTSLALALVDRLCRLAGTSRAAQHVPMDGFHLADVELDRLGRRDRKGAADTFDAVGYAALLRRLRAQPDDRPESVVYAPAFDREIEQPVAGSLPVFAETGLIVTEGNYLLLDEGPWSVVRGLLDEIWWVEAEPGARNSRLLERHQQYGKPHQMARDWIATVDDPNAAVIDATRGRADLVVSGMLDLPASSQQV